MFNINKEKNTVFSRQRLEVIIISAVVGLVSGAAAGIFSAGLIGGFLGQWLQNPLGIAGRPAAYEQTKRQNNILEDNNTQLEEKDEEQLVTSSVEKVSPAVVSIVVSKEVQQYNNSQFDFFNFPFDQFFGTPEQPNNQNNQPQTQKQKVGGGTGFIVTSDGLIVTNKHVVADSSAEYSVTLNSGKEYPATVVARDMLNDVAFLRIKEKDLPIVAFGDSDKLRAGQTVIAIGFSLGEYSNSVTKGIISGIGRDIVAGGAGESEQLQGVIQTDAAINPGNSGGPLINLSGEVIGINTAINQSGQLIGFAIPINQVKSIIQGVKENGKIIRPYLGVRYILINEVIAKENNLPYNYGALLVKGSKSSELAVLPTGPAGKAGIVENDIILEVNGQRIDEKNPLSRTVASFKPGDSINLKICHNGAEKDISIKLEQYPE